MIVNSHTDPPDPKNKYSRTWTLKLVTEVYRKTKEYCLLNKKVFDTLSINDYCVISRGFPVTPAQCMLKMHETSLAGTFKPGVWCKAEDELLFTLVQDGISWREIAEQLNATMHAGLRVRNSKNCQERWNNHLNPEINKGEWSEAEEKTIIQEFLKHGPKWTTIAKLLGNRTATAVKNRVNSLLKQHKKVQRIEGIFSTLNQEPVSHPASFGI